MSAIPELIPCVHQKHPVETISPCLLLKVKYPKEIRRYLYTTNAVENFNSRTKQIRNRLGGYFQSIEVLEINILLPPERLRQGKWKNSLPVLRSSTYEI